MRADRGIGRSEPTATPQPVSNRGGARAAGAGLAQPVSGLGGAKTDRVAEAGAGGATAHHGTPHLAAERLGAGSGPASGGDETLRAGSTESTVADGFQRDAGQ